MDNLNPKSNEQDTTWIPEEYEQVMGPNGQHYLVLFLVPELYMPALLNTLDVFERKKRLEIEKAAGTVSLSKCSVTGK